MITCPHCGQEFSEPYRQENAPPLGNESDPSNGSATGNDPAAALHPSRARVKTNDVRLALLKFPNLSHKKIGQMFGISRRRVWGIAERFRIATRHRSDREKGHGFVNRPERGRE